MSRLAKVFRKAIASNSRTLLMVIAFIGGLMGFIGAQNIYKPAAASVPHCNDVCVALKPGGMEPNELALKVGQYVQFNSADGQQHNIAVGEADNKGHHGHTSADLISGDFGADEAWRVQFKKPGTYKLHDHYHPNQEILIVVY